MHYVVYWDDVTEHARVHLSDCRHYRDRKYETEPNNGWYRGPYTLEDAFYKMLGHAYTNRWRQLSDAKVCERCKNKMMHAVFGE